MIHPHWENVCRHLRETVLPNGANPLCDPLLAGQIVSNDDFIDVCERPKVAAGFGDEWIRRPRNDVHQAYHLLRMLEVGINDFATIVEFGAGYGILRSMFSVDAYTIFDLPEMCALQKRFLSHTATRWITDVSEARLLPPTDLLIALWSLTETLIEYRYQVIAALNPKLIWIGQNDYFEDVDNTEWYKSIHGYVVESERIRHAPRSRYIWARRIEG